MRKLFRRLERDARAAGPGETGLTRDGQEERRRLRGLGVSGWPPRKTDLHGDSGVRPRGAGSPPGVERGIFFEGASGHVPQGVAPPARQPGGNLVFGAPRGGAMALALPRPESLLLEPLLRPLPAA